MDPDFERFSSSFQWDIRLVPYDLKIDRAHVKALRACGVLSGTETRRLLSAFSRLEVRFAKNALKLNASAEDVHSALQEEIEKWAGPVAEKLHTARSRNDLVAQSSRLYCKEHALKILDLLRDLQKAILSQAEKHQATFVAGMTHLQPAQVLSLGHIFLAYLEMLERAKVRFRLCANLSDVCVLGSGALAGVNYPLNQKRLARELGLSRVTDNSYDVSGDRDFLLNVLAASAFLGLHLSRIAEDCLLAQLKGISTIESDSAFCTGSSMMPQKKNADFVELARGAGGVFLGNLMGFAATLKGLPTSYNRDLQWDKKILFDSVETLEGLLPIFIKVFRTLQIHSDRAKATLQDESLYATDLADTLVSKGVPFKTAHDQVGRIVQFAEENGVAISRIGLDLLREIAPKLDGGVYALFNAEHSVKMKKTQGSTHPLQVRRQIDRWKKILHELRRYNA